MGYIFGVGREAPPFSLAAHDGSRVSLKQYRGDWFPILVFFPAAAPEAHKGLAALSTRADDFWGVRGQLVGVTDAGGDRLRELAASAGGLAFPLLSDEGARVSRLYKAWSQADQAVKPLIYIVDRSGKVVWVGEGGPDLPDAEDLLRAFCAVAK